MKKKKTAGRLLREWREKHGLTRVDVGDRIGVTAKHVKYLENDERCASPATAELLAEQTGFPMTTFLNMKPR